MKAIDHIGYQMTARTDMSGFRSLFPCIRDGIPLRSRPKGPLGGVREAYLRFSRSRKSKSNSGMLVFVKTGLTGNVNGMGALPSMDRAATVHIDHVLGRWMRFASIYCINATISIKSDPLKSSKIEG